MFSLNNQEQVRSFDKRVSESKIKILTQDKVDGEVWIYVTKSQEYRYDHGSAIDASYLYTFLSGCLDVQKHFQLDGFLANCMAFTYGSIPQIKYDLDRKIKKSRVVPLGNDMQVINKHICSDNNLFSYLKKDLVLYKKICK
jgi:hypothetical protein